MVRHLPATLLLATVSSLALAQHRNTSPHHSQPVTGHSAPVVNSAPQHHSIAPHASTAPRVSAAPRPQTITRPVPNQRPIMVQPNQHRPPVIVDEHRTKVHQNTNGHLDTSNLQHRDTSNDNRRHINTTTNPNAGLTNATNWNNNLRVRPTNIDEYYYDNGRWCLRSERYGKSYYRDYAPFYYYDSNYYGNTAGVTYLGSSALYDDSPAYSTDQLTYVTPEPSTWCDPVLVTISADKESYIQGEDVHLSIAVDQTSYIYVYTTDSSGVTQQLLPNYYDRNNFARARQSLAIPSGAFGLRAVGSGWDEIRVVAVNGRNGWNHPRATMSYNVNKPFITFPEGADGARQEIYGELANDFRSQYGHSPGAGGIVAVPGDRPYWGEAAIRIFIQERGVVRISQGNAGAEDASLVPPPDPASEQPGT